MDNTVSVSGEKTSVIRKLMARFLRLNIAKKMLLGYLTLVALIFLISVYTITSLERLNTINREIIRTDVPLVEIADRMIDALFAQELYARRYAILNSPEMLALSGEKGKEFDGLVQKVRTLPGAGNVPVERIVALHAEYRKLFAEGIKFLLDPASPRAKEYDSVIRAKQEELIALIKNISSKARQDQTEKTILTEQVGTVAFRITVILCVVSILLSIVSTMLITRSIAGPISRLRLATEKISEGKFELIGEIKNRDELGDLFLAFNEMTTRLKRLEEMYLDASPLTRLPGNIVIENVLQKRIDAGSPLAFCHLDMDNFKAFNDRYGYAKGSEVIVATSRIIEQCTAEAGSAEDFVGHIGGDDFVLITTPDRFRKTCKAIIETFDSTIPKFYDPVDLKKGYIMGKTRQGQQSRFPVMSISIAVVTNLERQLTNSIQVGELAAELKDYAKAIPGSVYVVDRRREGSREESGDKVIPFSPKTSSQKDS